METFPFQHQLREHMVKKLTEAWLETLHNFQAKNCPDEDTRDALVESAFRAAAQLAQDGGREPCEVVAMLLQLAATLSSD